jgi:hypothetical protein
MRKPDTFRAEQGDDERPSRVEARFVAVVIGAIVLLLAIVTFYR